MANRSREVTPSLYSALGEDVDLLEQVQRSATEMIRGIEHLSYEERLRALGLFSLEKRRLWRDLITAFQYLKEACKKGRDRLCKRACCDRTRDNGFKLKKGRFRRDVRKQFFYSDGKTQTGCPERL